MLVRGACIETEPPEYGFADRDFDYARAFQNRVAEWVHEDDEPVAVLRAPTGAGKTATFHELIADNDLTLLVYPTNALLRQQRERFEADGVTAKVLNSDTLDGRCHERTENLLSFVNPYENHDVLITNPDILQATIQGMYRGTQAMEFFDRFDAIVYDEFHFYEPLAASGLLLQLKIISERLPTAKVLLASATPNDEFVAYVRDRLGIDVRDIGVTYAEDGDRFRHDVQVERREERRILDAKADVADHLRLAIESADDLTDPKVALVFNSARDSNEFHDYLHDEHETVFKHTEKDNGFDTNDDELDIEDREFFVLNTTSKGEVGLDYDVTTLFMETPWTASAFLQRFGRAGRDSEATVHTFGLGQGPWQETVSFPEFTKQVYKSLDDPEMHQQKLADLVGVRAAYAMHVRDDDDKWFNAELRKDFASNVEHYGRWRAFIRSIEDELDKVGGFGGEYTERSAEARLLGFTKDCFRAFRGLRGRSLPAEIKYPRGDRLGATTYDLTTTLRTYDIARVEDDDVLVLEPGDDTRSVVTACLPEYESQPTPYHEPVSEIEDKLKTKITREIERVADNDDLGMEYGMFHRFYQIIRITNAVVPTNLTASNYEITVSDDGTGPPDIEVHRRQI